MNRLILSLAILTLFLAACVPVAATSIPASSPTSSVTVQPSPLPSTQPARTKKPKNNNAQGTQPAKPPKGQNPQAAPTSTNPDFIATEILGLPTDSSVTVSVVPASAMTVFYEYGTASGAYTSQTEPQSATANMPLETVIGGLQPNTRYYYRISYDGKVGAEHSFITQRAADSTFTFAVQADSHLNTDQHCDPDLYRLTMLNIAAYQPDFFIDLGDTFRTDKLRDINAANIAQIYLDQRQFFGMVSADAPLFLVNGNHEMEWGWLLDDSADNPAVMSANARNLYFPQPSPDNFYIGDALSVPNIGQLHDYYAWTWGDALFVVIDPYWQTTTDPKKSKDNWDWTLGEAQYQWFRQTLETSDAKFKFVFTHHVVGENRGGADVAPYFEWGGQNRDGVWGFDAQRPGWGKPIHQLMVENGVTVFFQGHDHLFARQELDGVIYQTVPMPADPSYSTDNANSYLSGDILPASGHLRVTVSPQGVTVDYIRSFLPQDENANQQNGMIAFTYTVAP